jgi:hypothetical protein
MPEQVPQQNPADYRPVQQDRHIEGRAGGSASVCYSEFQKLEISGIITSVSGALSFTHVHAGVGARGD